MIEARFIGSRDTVHEWRSIGLPPIWRAVCDLAAALHAGYWPMALDERWPGSDEVGQHVGVVSGDEIEAVPAQWWRVSGMLWTRVNQ